MNTNKAESLGPRAVETKPTPPAERGRTFIDDDVVSVITRVAAENVEGIHRIGEPSLRNLLTTLARSSGVDAEVGMQEAAADIEVVVEFGYPIREVAAAIREQVIRTVEQMTGRRMIEVNVHVVDIHVPKTERRTTRRELR